MQITVVDTSNSILNILSNSSSIRQDGFLAALANLREFIAPVKRQAVILSNHNIQQLKSQVTTEQA
jgi:hypothetical protein